MNKPQTNDGNTSHVTTILADEEQLGVLFRQNGCDILRIHSAKDIRLSIDPLEYQSWLEKAMKYSEPYLQQPPENYLFGDIEYEGTPKGDLAEQLHSYEKTL